VLTVVRLHRELSNRGSHRQLQPALLSLPALISHCFTANLLSGSTAVRLLRAEII